MSELVLADDRWSKDENSISKMISAGGVLRGVRADGFIWPEKIERDG